MPRVEEPGRVFLAEREGRPRWHEQFAHGSQVDQLAGADLLGGFGGVMGDEAAEVV